MKILIALALLLCLGMTCMNRTTAVARAMEWVTAGIPYNASAYHDAYFQSCEGIVGYAWKFPIPGIYSGSLEGKWCTKITKDHLMMGDIMVNPGEHQLLFHSWATTDKTQYIAIELSPSGSRKHTLPYPYWSNYHPERYFPCQVLEACVGENMVTE